MKKLTNVCPECAGEMTPYDTCTEKIICVPFSKFEIVLRHYYSTAWCCFHCDNERKERTFAECYYAGKQDGYSKAYDDLTRGL